METSIFRVRETLQMRILSELFRHTRRHEIIVKGGIGMRVSVNSVRYTKDIDLDANPLTEAEQTREWVRASVRTAVFACSSYISNIKITEPKQTDTTLRWKINGLFADTSEPFQLTVEVSRRGFLARDHIITTTFTPPAEYNLSPIMVEVYDSKALMVSKISAMLNDNRDAPRDLYDLGTLFGMGVEPDCKLMKELFQRQKMGPEEMMGKLWKKLDMFTWERFGEEVLPYFEKMQASRFNEEYFNSFVLMVGEKLQELLSRYYSQEEELDEANSNCPGGM
jgi:predicted nucleotidyltransferase component of viral defense system